MFRMYFFAWEKVNHINCSKTRKGFHTFPLSERLAGLMTKYWWNDAFDRFLIVNVISEEKSSSTWLYGVKDWWIWLVTNITSAGGYHKCAPIVIKLDNDSVCYKVNSEPFRGMIAACSTWSVLDSIVVLQVATFVGVDGMKLGVAVDMTLQLQVSVW